MLFDPCPGDCGCQTAATGTWRVYTTCGSPASATAPFVASPVQGIGGTLCNVYSDSGRTALVASGTTDSVGRLNLTLPSGVFCYPRLTHPSGLVNPYDAPAFVTATGINTDRTYRLAPVVGYMCSPCCNAGIPIPSTLHASTNFGDVTLVRDETGFARGVIEYEWGGSASCGPATVPITVTLGQCTIQFSLSGPNAFPYCPGTGTLIPSFGSTATAFTCSPFSMSGGATRNIGDLFTGNPNGGAMRETLQNLFGSGFATFWYEVTE